MQAVAVSSDCYKCPLTEKGHSSVVKLLGGRGSFESLCASVQRPLSWIPLSAVLRLYLFRVPHEPCRRVRRGAGSSLPWAALPSLSESFMVAVFLRVRECMMDREASLVNFRWRGASLEPVHHCVSASMDTAHVGLVTPRSEVWGNGSVHPRGSDGALGSGSSVSG